MCGLILSCVIPIVLGQYKGTYCVYIYIYIQSKHNNFIRYRVAHEMSYH